MFLVFSQREASLKKGKKERDGSMGGTCLIFEPMTWQMTARILWGKASSDQVGQHTGGVREVPKASD